jgi:sugar transferase (PEP-CTERM system associated)
MLRIFNQYVSAKSVLLMLLESLLIFTSLLCAARLRFWNSPEELAIYLAFPDFAMQSGIVIAVCMTCFYFNDLYNLSALSGPLDSILRIQQSLGTASLLLGLFYFLFPNMLLSRGVFLIGMVLVAAFLVLSRKLLDTAWQLTAHQQRVAIVGTGELAIELARELTRRPDLNMELAGFVDTAGGKSADRHFGIPVLGSAHQMEAITHEHRISRIIVALEDRRGALPTRELVTVRVQGVRVEDAPTALSALTGRISLRAVRPSWFVFSDGFHRSRWNDVLKRILDLFWSIVGLILSLPIMALVALAIKLDTRGPVVYRQARVGAKGRIFEVLKFRSMRTDAENGTAQWAQKDDPRVTRVGGFLRKYRLDELPQFLNVIRGEMSFVGPRPERPCFVEELRQTIPYYDERHTVRPGITGWAQVQYTYAASVEDASTKLEYDLFYLKNMSVIFDLAIIFRTIRIVTGGRGSR